jgi:hypothetical protein
MTAQKPLAPTAEDFAMLERRQAGATYRAIAAEFGITANRARDRVWLADRYVGGAARLAADSLDIEALGYMGIIEWQATGALLQYGVRRLSDLTAWSAAELRQVGDYSQFRARDSIGPKRLAQIKAALAAHGLALHPDRPEPIRRQPLWARSAHADLPAFTALRVVDNVVYGAFGHGGAS